MSGRRRRVGHRYGRAILAATAVVLVFAALAFAAWKYDSDRSLLVEHAGEQLTVYSRSDNTAQYYVNGQWVAERDLDTLLVIGIDNLGSVSTSDSYNNANQADFLALFLRDKKSGESAVIHLNRDSMAEIPVLGVTGQRAGSEWGQLALAYTYGHGGEDSSENTVLAVSEFLYGIEIDHYITLSMDAVPILNDWVGGVTVEVLDDLTGVDSALVQGETVHLAGDQALAYVRTRMGLADSTNLHRMERQQQYARGWMDAAVSQMSDEGKVLELLMKLGSYHYSDCTADELGEYAEFYSTAPPAAAYEIMGENVRGDEYMEYIVDEAALEELVLYLFYEPVG